MSDGPSGRSGPEVRQPDHASVVYDAKTGRVVLVHQVATVGGGTPRSAAELDREALVVAKAHGVGAGLLLRTLTVNPTTLVPGVIPKVDVKRLTVVLAERPSLSKTGASKKRKR